MKILAVDTSSMAAAAAVVEDTRLLGEYILNHKKTHSQKLMPMIKELLGSLELSPKDIDLFAASSGPGSFTGLRIGVTTIKSLAYAVRKPVVSVPTLDALAYNVAFTRPLICPIMDARNNQVYTAVYSSENGFPSKITEYLGIPVPELVEIIKSESKKTMFVGDAVEVYRQYLKDELLDLCEFAPHNLLLSRASSVAGVALVLASQGKLENCFDMVPFYLRKSQAEREYENRAKGEGKTCV